MDLWQSFINYDYIFITTICILSFWVLTLLYFTTRGICKSKVQMDGKTVLITGSDSGIGKETAVDLARRGARVIMACVNIQNALNVRDEITKKTGNGNIKVSFIDLSNFDSVRKFAREVIQKEPRLDVLIHNAGILTPPEPVNKNGINMTMATNFFGPFLLTNLLLDLLKKTKDSRVIFVVSSSHKLHQAIVDPEHPNPLQEKPSKKFNFIVYSMSKFACVIFAMELARKLQGSGVSVNCLHPGMVATSIIIGGCILPDWFYSTIAILIPFVKTPKQGAQTSIFLAVSDEVKGISGKYFIDCKINFPAEATQDQELAKRYWQVCEQIVGIQSL